MTRRRTLLLGGAAAIGVVTVGGVAATGRLDDVVRVLGIDPVPLPDADDTALLTEAADDTARLIAVVGPLSSTVTRLLTEHLDALGGAPAAGDSPAADLAAARVALLASASTRRDQAVAATSPDLARVLGSVSVALGLMGAGVIA